MCGVIGYNLSHPGKKCLSNGINSIAHRGPDGKGVFYEADEGIGLGHVRLSILDLSSAGAQPMTSSNGRYVITYNGEIYNHLELRKELEDHGIVFVGESDTEVLLELFSLKGVDALCQLQGIFAFAIYDNEEKNIILARDKFGVKPLYYTCTDNGVFFSSEIAGLISLDCDPGEVDVASAASHLAFLWNPRNISIASNFKKLPPGHLIKIKKGKTVQFYEWIGKNEYQQSKFLIKKTSKQKLISDTRRILRNAVHKQMISDVPLGAFLSGGLDSSSIVAFAKEKNKNIQCFTIDTKGGGENGVSNDLVYAKEVANYLNLDLNIVEVSADKFAQDLSLMVRQFEEPIADPASLNTFYISKMAQEAGVKVLLSGTGGDDIFTGYRRHQAVWWDQYFQLIPGSIRKGMEIFGNKLDKRNHLKRRLSKFLEGFSLSHDERLINFFYWTKPELVEYLLSDNLKNDISRVKIEAPIKEVLSNIETEDSIERILEIEKRFFLSDHNLLYTDKMSMACGVEVRVPFLDDSLVKFSSSIPSKLKQRGVESKWILKKAMEHHLPYNVIYRPKAGFGIPLRRWLSDDLKDFVMTYLSADRILNRGLFNPKSVKELIDANINGRIDASYTILSLLCIEIWCETYLDIQ